MSEQHTLTQLLDLYEREVLPTKAEATQYQSRVYFVRLKAELGAMRLDELTPDFFRVWRDKLRTRYSAGTVRRYLHLLSGPLSVAHQEYAWIASHPLRKVRKPPDSPSRVRFLSDEERTALLRACQVSRNPHLHAMVLLALSTGARKNQLRFLRWRDVDFVRAVIRVGSQKKAPRRTIPLSGPVLQLLQKRSADQPPEAWVFARHDGARPLLIDAAFRSACKRAKIADFTFHDLRHSCASYLAMSGASLRDIMEVLGHTSPAMTAKYTHLTEGHTAGVLGRMVGKMFPASDAPSEGGPHGA